MVENKYLTEAGYKLLALRFVVQMFEEKGFPDALARKIDKFLTQVGEQGEREQTIWMINLAAQHPVLYQKILTANSADYNLANQGGQKWKDQLKPLS